MADLLPTPFLLGIPFVLLAVLPRGAAPLWGAGMEVPRRSGTREMRAASLWDAGRRRASLERRASPRLLTDGPGGKKVGFYFNSGFWPTFILVQLQCRISIYLGSLLVFPILV